jgi:N utilization substance protein B
VKNPKSEARELAVQFLYQSESEKLLHFSDSHFDQFVKHFQVAEPLIPPLREMTRGTLENLIKIDAKLQDVSVNWKLSRMSVIDRSVLRLATYELLESDTPTRVVLNEAIELAKKYGAEDSGKFVNGLLDKVAHQAR